MSQPRSRIDQEALQLSDWDMKAVSILRQFWNPIVERTEELTRDGSSEDAAEAWSHLSNEMAVDLTSFGRLLVFAMGGSWDFRDPPSWMPRVTSVPVVALRAVANRFVPSRFDWKVLGGVYAADVRLMIIRDRKEGSEYGEEIAQVAKDLFFYPGRGVRSYGMG